MPRYQWLGAAAFVAMAALPFGSTQAQTTLNVAKRPLPRTLPHPTIDTLASQPPVMPRYQWLGAAAFVAMAALPFGSTQAQTTLNVATAGDQNMVDYVNNYLAPKF